MANCRSTREAVFEIPRLFFAPHRGAHRGAGE